MIGQERLLLKLKSYTLKSLPKAVMLIGEDGCGKHTMVNELAEHYGLGVIEVDPAVEPETLAEYAESPVPTAYVLNLDAMLEKQQNRFLKFIEEPGKAAYVFVVTASDVGVLPTILNRCLVFRFDDYTKEQLAQVDPSIDDLTFAVCKTPGQLATIDRRSIAPMYQWCFQLLFELPNAAPAKILGYAYKINYKEDYDKFDFRAFFRMIEYVALSEYVKGANDLYYSVYRFTADSLKKLSYKNIAKESFALNYFNKLKEAALNGRK